MKGIKKLFKKEKMNFTSLNIEGSSAVTTHQAPVLDVRQSEEFDTDGHCFSNIYSANCVDVKSTNIIFICSFGEKYIELLFILLESLYLFSNIGNVADIMIYTDTKCMSLIKESPYYTQRILFRINDKYDSTLEKCRARLDFFELDVPAHYTKVLYLDCDIIVRGNISNIFDCIKDTTVYVVEEGMVECSSDLWGASLFKDKCSISVEGKTAFSTGIMLFPVEQRIHNMFSTAKQMIETSTLLFSTYEQPFIIYTLITNECYNNQLLKEYVYNNNCINIRSFEDSITKAPIIHFCGMPGITFHKKENMKKYLHILKKRIVDGVDIYNDVWTISKKFRYDILYFFNNMPKTTIVEVGSYKGYTTRFLSKIFDSVVCIDNNSAFHSLNMQLNHDRTNICYYMFDLYKDTWASVQNNIEFAFIDAGHSYEECKSDIKNCLSNFKQLKYIVFDDYGVWAGVKKAVDEYIQLGVLQFQTFVGLYEKVPGPNDTTSRYVHEGIVVSVNTGSSLPVLLPPSKDNTIGITVSVNYSKYLKDTIGYNKNMFHKLFVITDPTDINTIKLCETHSITCLMYDDVRKNNANFDKSTLIRRCQKYIHTIYPTYWITYIDADIIVPSDIYNITWKDNISEDTIFTCRRKIYNNINDYESKIEKKNSVDDISTCYLEGAGFFQMYYNKTKFYPFNYSYYGKKNAAGCDLYFQNLFYDRRFLRDKYCSHIGDTSVNWDGIQD